MWISLWTRWGLHSKMPEQINGSHCWLFPGSGSHLNPEGETQRRTGLVPGSFLEDCPLSLRTSATTQGSMGMVVRECTGKEPTSWRPKSTEASLGNGCLLAVKVIGSMLGKVWKLSKTLPLFFYFRPSNLFHMLLNPAGEKTEALEFNEVMAIATFKEILFQSLRVWNPNRRRNGY